MNTRRQAFMLAGALTVETSMMPRAATSVTGSFGVLPSDRATTLALVLAELVANAVEHGSVGQPDLRVEVSVRREAGSMAVSATRTESVRM